MSTETWPTGLPQMILRRGYREAKGDNIVRFQPEAGPAKRRRRFTATRSPLRGRMILSPEQRDIFRQWYRGPLRDGELCFTFPNPQGGTDLTVAFSSPPALTPSRGVAFTLFLSLEIQV